MDYALITGASSGIGLEFAKVFASNNINLVLVARSVDKLNSLANDIESEYKVKVEVINIDLSVSENIYILYEKIAEANIKIKYLINNAGFGLKGEFLDLKLSEQQDMLRLNMETLTTLCWLFGRSMKKNKSGYILNVASVAAFLPGPYMSVYYATKSYVLSFSIALANELNKYGVVVNVLCPGPTESNFSETANMQNSSLFKLTKLASSKDVAEFGYKQLLKEKKVSIYGLNNKFIVFISKFTSKIFMSKITAFLHKS